MTKQCTQCSKSFLIDQPDQRFYDRLTVPPPTQCPDCRVQRRLAWRNERMLYERQCDLCRKNMISMYRSDAPYVVYCPDCWWSDRWDSTSYARAYDPKRPFFEQFADLLHVVPRLTLSNNQAENSPYINWADRNRNCYLSTSCNDNDNCYYGFWMVGNSDCVDIAYAVNNRLSYELVDCTNCNQVRFSQDCRDCNEAWFLYDCVSCSNCFGCTNLRSKQYCVFNKQYTAAEYHKLVERHTKNREALDEAALQFTELKKKAIQKFAKGVNNTAVTGGGISNSQNATYCFDGFELVDCAYSFDGLRTKDSYDLSFFSECELIYESHSVIGYNMQFVNMCRMSPGTQYSDTCHNSKDLFGCVGLRKKQWCIFNQTYSEQAYKKLRGEIIQHMMQTGEYGEFFPVQYSPFGYNETLANDFFPLTQSEVLARGWQWSNLPQKKYTDTVVAAPDDLVRTYGDVSKAVYACRQCQRHYKVIPQEVELYRTLQVQLPTRCSICRQQDRERLRNPWKLFKRQCMCTQTDHNHHGRCAVEFDTNYAPENTAIVYCANCYQKEVY